MIFSWGQIHVFSVIFKSNDVGQVYYAWYCDKTAVTFRTQYPVTELCILEDLFDFPDFFSYTIHKY